MARFGWLARTPAPAAAALALLVALVVPTSGAAGATVPRFVTEQSFPYPSDVPAGVSCVGTSFCMQLDYGRLSTDFEYTATVVTTDDAGATWQAVGTLPTRGGAIAFQPGSELSCASTTVCLVETVGSGFGAVTTDGGSTWQVLEGDDVPVTTCFADATCLSMLAASGSAGVRTAWTAPDGAAFTARGPSVLAAGWAPEALACASATTCVLSADSSGGDEVAVTTTAGSSDTWQADPLPAGTRLISLSCPTASVCDGVEAVTSTLDGEVRLYLARSTDGGASWARTATLPIPVPLVLGPLGDGANLECASATVCIATLAYSFSPFSSQRPGIPIAGEVDTLLSVDGGAAWTTHRVGDYPPGFLTLAQASCLAGAGPTCFTTYGLQADALDIYGNELSTTDGTTWSPVPLAPTDASTLSTACTTGDTCYRVDDDASDTGLATTLLTSADGGVTWRSVPVPASFEPLAIGGCQGAATCEVAGVTGVTLFDALEGLWDFEAATPVLLTTSDGGGTWRTTPIPQRGALPIQASCSSSTRCVVVEEQYPPGGGDDLLVSRVHGTRWATTAAPYFPGWGDPVSTAVGGSGLGCSSAGFCMAGLVPGPHQTSAALVSSDGGTTWRRVTLPPSAAVDGIACFGAGDCDVLYGGLGVGEKVVRPFLRLSQTTDGGVTWHRAAVPVWHPSFGGGGQLACTSFDDCTVVASSIDGVVPVRTTTDGGTTWSAEGWGAGSFGVRDPGLVDVGSLSCSASACLAVAELGRLGATGSLELVRMTR